MTFSLHTFCTTVLSIPGEDSRPGRSLVACVAGVKGERDGERENERNNLWRGKKKQKGKNTKLQLPTYLGTLDIQNLRWLHSAISTSCSLVLYLLIQPLQQGEKAN